MTGQLQIAACMLSGWEARPLSPLSGASELGIDGEGCGQLVAAGLGEIGRGGCETGHDGSFGTDVVAGGWNRRMPT